MRYELQIRLTEEEYIASNIFHTTRSPYGQQSSRRLKWLVAGLLALAVVMSFVLRGVNESTVLYAVLVALLGGLFLWRFDRFFSRSMKRTVKQMTKTGKKPYAPESTLIFTEEGILEITPEAKTERQWSSVERLCLVEGKVWYLYLNSAAAFILPVAQLDAQTDIGELYRFLEGKCPAVDRFGK